MTLPAPTPVPSLRQRLFNATSFILLTALVASLFLLVSHSPSHSSSSTHASTGFSASSQSPSTSPSSSPSSILIPLRRVALDRTQHAARRKREWRTEGLEHALAGAVGGGRKEETLERKEQPLSSSRRLASILFNHGPDHNDSSSTGESSSSSSTADSSSTASSSSSSSSSSSDSSLSSTASSSTNDSSSSSSSSTGSSSPSAESSSTTSNTNASSTGSDSSSSSTGPIPGRVHLIDYSDFLYIGVLGIGTPVQSFGVVFDTGSADTWVFSPELKAEYKHTWQHFYNQSVSSSYEPISGENIQWHIQYGKGEVTGKKLRETVSLAGKPILQHALIATADSIPENAVAAFSQSNEPIDGIFGLGFEKLATDSRMAIMPLAGEKGLPATFAFHMSSSQTGPTASNSASLAMRNSSGGSGEESISRTDSLIRPDAWFEIGASRSDTTYAPLGFTDIPILDPSHESVHGRWIIEIDAVSVDGSYVRNMCLESAGATARCAAWIDTGSSFILLPPGRFLDIMSSLIASRPDCKIEGACPGTPGAAPGSEARVTCALRQYELLPAFTLTLGGQDFVLAPEEYTLLDEDIDATGTITKFMQLGFGCAPKQSADNGAVDLWLIGDTFLRNYYVLFDMNAQMISIANKQGLRVKWWIVLVITGSMTLLMLGFFMCIRWRYDKILVRRSAAGGGAVAGELASSTSVVASAADPHADGPAPPSSTSVLSMLQRARGRGVGYAQVENSVSAGELHLSSPTAAERAQQRKDDIEMARIANDDDGDEPLAYDEEDLMDL